jgi:hypothetical protein
MTRVAPGEETTAASRTGPFSHRPDFDATDGNRVENDASA